MSTQAKSMMQGVYRIRLVNDDASETVYMQSNTDDPKKPFIELKSLDRSSDKQKACCTLLPLHHLHLTEHRSLF